MVINRKIMNELKKKESQSRIYAMIKKIRENSGYSVVKEEAACLLAGQLGIDITKFLQSEELEKLKSLQSITPIKIITKGDKKSIKIITVKIGRFNIKEQESFLPKKTISEARKMADKVYPIFYVFENSARNLILIVMESRYRKNWWDNKVPKDIQKKVNGRLKQEGGNKWHSKRNVHKIFYTDFGDLKSIITNNWNDFKKFFPRQDWITSRFSDLELSRNIIAHNNPLQDDDIKRLETYFKDWIRQLGSIKKLEVKKNE